MPGQLSAIFNVFHTLCYHKSVLLNMLHMRNLHLHNNHSYSALPTLNYHTCIKKMHSQNLVGPGNYFKTILITIRKKMGGGGVCPKYRIFICFWWFVWFRNLQLRWHGGICKEAGQECKEEEGAFHQEIFQTKKQLATEASTDFCPSSFVLVHVCMFILKNWVKCAFPASYMMTFLCTVYIYIYVMNPRDGTQKDACWNSLITILKKS